MRISDWSSDVCSSDLDDELIARGIVSGLRAFGITADRVESVAHAELARQTTHCDAMVLDLGLPDEDGMQLLVRMRQSGDELQVLLLTARDAVEDRIAGLQGGAADYLEIGRGSGRGRGGR